MKIQAAFQLDKELLEQLEQRAKAEKRTLDNYVEHLLLQVIEASPNQATQQAIYEAEHNIGLTKIDDLTAFKKSLLFDV